MSVDEALEIAKQEYILIPKAKKPETPSEKKVIDTATAVVCEEYGFTMEEIVSRSRKGYIPRARYRIFYLTKLIFPSVGIRNMGRKFGMAQNNAHSNVIHGINQMTGEIKIMPKIKEEMLYLEKRVREELLK